ncbi:MAG: HDOD domain-containing protein [Pseudomonadales bacterium]|nr:HDOD domain-containing protein [Pseudomonadales bacterium]
MNVFLARQPVFDRNLNVIAYELLYRAGGQVNSAEGMLDPNQASKEVLVNAFSEIGLEKITNGLPALVNITQDILVSGALPKGLQKLLIPEVLEDVLVNKDVIQEVKNLINLGYSVALDDFVYSEEWLPLVRSARYIKLDVLQLGTLGVKEQLAKLRMTGAVEGKLLAEKVETHEEFELYRTLGFDYFQGYFLCKPHVMEGESVPASGLVITSLLAELSKDDYDIEQVERIICQDPRLSYKLLRVVNSASFGLSRTIKTISDAIVILGSQELRRWSSMLALSSVDNKPNELLVTAIVRAKMCELVADKLGRKFAGGYFTAGLLSLLDALLDKPLNDIVSKMPLSAEIELALLTGGGDVGQVLQAVVSYEKGQFDEALPDGLAVDDLWEIYINSLEWANVATHAMLDKGK